MGANVLTLDGRINYSTNNLIERNFPCIIGLEAAATWWGLGTYNDSRNIMLVEDSDAPVEGEFIDADIAGFFVPSIDRTQLIKLSDCVSVTSKAQTVCDVIRYDRSLCYVLDIVMEAEESDDEAFKSELYALLDKYGLRQKYNELYAEAVDAFENQ